MYCIINHRQPPPIFAVGMMMLEDTTINNKLVEGDDGVEQPDLPSAAERGQLFTQVCSAKRWMRP